MFPLLNSKHALRAVFALLIIGVIFSISWIVSDNSRLTSELKKAEEKLAVAQTDSTCASRDTWKENTTREFTLTSSGKHRAYRVHLPKDYIATHSYPLILAFTGKGGSAKQFEASIGLKNIPAITVYPQPLIGKDGTTSWEGAPYSPNTDDVLFINSMLDKIEGQLCIQKTRIYSVGFSNGGGMSWVLSCQASDRIAAFAMVAGAFYYPEEKCKAKRSTPVLNIHGDKDSEVPYDGSVTRKLPKIDEWVLHHASANRCRDKPSVGYPNLTTQVTTWSGCQDNATVQNIRIVGGGHTWPLTLTMQLKNKRVAVQKTTDILWNFFILHPLR